ncbi:unnamed protein product [Gongylonema pulchrum]|uniref:CUB domain-containing protein n=1 Tax=Gongylonema pulchrum TaxID=637853 RepID=A0A183D7S7_9BILA|nr:unnamed protein product [Gongylonema pulchrum]
MKESISACGRRTELIDRHFTGLVDAEHFYLTPTAEYCRLNVTAYGTTGKNVSIVVSESGSTVQLDLDSATYGNNAGIQSR